MFDKNLIVLDNQQKLSEEELTDINGGIGIGTGIVIVGGIIFLGGVFVGYTEEKKGK